MTESSEPPSPRTTEQLSQQLTYFLSEPTRRKKRKRPRTMGTTPDGTQLTIIEERT